MVQLNDDMEIWMDKQCEILGGMSASSFINMALANYKQQMEMMSRMKDMPGMLNEMAKLMDLAKKIESNDKK